MITQKKHIEEKLILDYFKQAHIDFPKGRLVKSESPDFVLKVGIKKTIGIELTRLDENALTLKERIESTLDRKNQKIASYQSKKFNSIWLIIHTDLIEESKSYNIQTS